MRAVLVAIERQQLDLDTLLAEHAEEEAALAAMTASELLHGVHRAKTARQRTRREAFSGVQDGSKKRAFPEGEPYHAHHESTACPYCRAHRWETLTANGGHGQPSAQAERGAE